MSRAEALRGNEFLRLSDFIFHTKSGFQNLLSLKGASGSPLPVGEGLGVRAEWIA
jgi:hypothetical protein